MRKKKDSFPLQGDYKKRKLHRKVGSTLCVVSKLNFSSNYIFLIEMPNLLGFRMQFQINLILVTNWHTEKEVFKLIKLCPNERNSSKRLID